MHGTSSHIIITVVPSGNTSPLGSVVSKFHPECLANKR